MNLLGARVAMAGEVEEYDANNRRAVLRVTPARGNGTTIRNEVIVEDLDGSSVLHFVTHVELSKPLAERITNRFIIRKLDQTARYGLSNIKEILEEGQEQTMADLARAVSEEAPPAERYGEDK
ncbi:hypothetical protein JOD57_003866 [Geodermatophilus bullaregiensis]|nr:hypothetical protein [Geodermatophilus bullaregiensis]